MTTDRPETWRIKMANEYCHLKGKRAAQTKDSPIFFLLSSSKACAHRSTRKEFQSTPCTTIRIRNPDLSGAIWCCLLLSTAGSGTQGRRSGRGGVIVPQQHFVFHHNCVHSVIDCFDCRLFPLSLRFCRQLSIPLSWPIPSF